MSQYLDVLTLFKQPYIANNFDIEDFNATRIKFSTIHNIPQQGLDGVANKF